MMEFKWFVTVYVGRGTHHHLQTGVYCHNRVFNNSFDERCRGWLLDSRSKLAVWANLLHSKHVGNLSSRWLSQSSLLYRKLVELQILDTIMAVCDNVNYWSTVTFLNGSDHSQKCTNLCLLIILFRFLTELIVGIMTNVKSHTPL